jgi:superkiller protein 3
MIITNSNIQNKIISPKFRSDYSLSPERDEPYHLSLDKDDYSHLSSEMDEVYYSLLRTLKRKKGFGLFFVVLSSPIKIDKVITRLQKDLPQKIIHDLEIDRQATTLYDQIAKVYRQTKCDILCFKNLESALYDYEDTKRLSGWSEEEAYAYSWKGVPPILNHLNQQRERLSRDFPFSLVFFVPSFAIDYLIQRSPDFFDWRSGVFRFPFTDQELSEQLTEFIQGDLDIYLSFTPEQRVQKILGIRDLILAADRDAEATSKLYFEQSLLFLSGNQYNKAIERLDKVIELQPNNYKALAYKEFYLNSM